MAIAERDDYRERCILLSTSWPGDKTHLMRSSRRGLEGWGGARREIRGVADGWQTVERQSCRDRLTRIESKEVRGAPSAGDERTTTARFVDRKEMLNGSCRASGPEIASCEP